MGNIELSNNEYQGLLDAQAEARNLRKELEKATSEIENKNKAIEEERSKRKKISERITELESTLQEKEQELSSTLSQYENFEELKQKASLWENFETTKKTELETKLQTLTESLTPDILEKHNKFIEKLDDELKIEYLENLKNTNVKQDIQNNPSSETEKQPKLNERLAELEGRRNSLSPSEKVEYLTLVSQQESQ